MRNKMLIHVLSPGLAVCFLTATASAAAQPVVHHPLDALTTTEYWNVYDALQAAGHVTPETLFASVLLHPPDKQAVLRWQPGQTIPSRLADVVLLRDGKSLAGLVDATAKKVLRLEELPAGRQAPFVTSELMGANEYIKKDPRVVEALAKRGIRDLNTVQCVAVPTSYRVIPEQASQRIGIGSCSQVHRVYHGWGRSVDGLSMYIDVAAKKILRVVDTEAIPVPTSDINYEEIVENPRPHTTPLLAGQQPLGPSYQIGKGGGISWQNWQFRVRVDPRVGTVLNLVQFVDKGKARSILYEANVSELFVPYMDTANGWNNRAFIDAGEFFASAGFLKPLKPGLDCPSESMYFDGLGITEQGSPKLSSNMACLFERDLGNPAWRHSENGEIFGRPSRQLVLRSSATVGNYDYILDWRFEQDGTIEVAVGATGIIETKGAASKRAPASAMSHDGDGAMASETGQFVGENIIGVNHDHFFSYRLDFDVDGVANSFMTHKLVRQEVANDPMRKSIWVAKPTLAAHEKDAILDIQLEHPSMWMFMNPAVKSSLNYPVAYEVMPGPTAKSLMSADDPIQKAGAFSEHQFWVTPYDASQRYAAGLYPTASQADDGLPAWTKANRPIANTDIVGWYTLGFHHVTRAEDWPVMPVMWHHFQIRPFHFFQANPVLDLPKSNNASAAK